MLARILEEMRDAPATSGELTAELELPPRYASSMLRKALARGWVVRTVQRVMANTRGAPSFMYELTPAGAEVIERMPP